MKKMYYPIGVLSLFMLGIISFLSCEKEDAVPSETGDETPLELIELLDEFEVVDVNLDDVVAINGLSPAQLDNYLNEKYGRQSKAYSPNDQLIELTTYLAINQLTFTNWRKYAQKYPDQPYGLAYVSNGKTDAQHDPLGNTDCQEILAGLDCSGMLYQSALKLGISIYQGKAADQATSKNWIKWLKDTKYTHIVVEKVDITSWDASDWKTGDIIVFDNGSHIGTIVNLKSGGIGIIHSQGNTTFSCEENKSPGRGPRVITSSNTKTWAKVVTSGISRMRFILADSYNLSMKCMDKDYLLYTINLSIDTDKSGMYQDEVVFVDYDGSINHQIIDYTYDKSTKVLDFILDQTDSFIPGGTRKDVFSYPLSMLGQFVPTEATFTGGMWGCDSEYKLQKGFAYNIDISLKSDAAQSDDGDCAVGY